jgi:hypothetical protein
VRDGLLLVGPGFKPNGDRRKRKKNRKKKIQRTCWVPKTKPNPSDSTADLAAPPATVSMSAMGSGGQESVPERATTSDGTCHPPTTITSSEIALAESASKSEWGSRPDTTAADMREEKEEMGIARSMDQTVGSTEADGGVSAPLEIQAPVSNTNLLELGSGPVINVVDTVISPPLLFAGGPPVVPTSESLTSQPVPSNGSELPVSMLEVVPKVPDAPATIRMDSDTMMVV